MFLSSKISKISEISNLFQAWGKNLLLCLGALLLVQACEPKTVVVFLNRGGADDKTPSIGKESGKSNTGNTNPNDNLPQTTNPGGNTNNGSESGVLQEAKYPERALIYKGSKVSINQQSEGVSLGEFSLTKGADDAHKKGCLSLKGGNLDKECRIVFSAVYGKGAQSEILDNKFPLPSVAAKRDLSICSTDFGKQISSAGENIVLEYLGVYVFCHEDPTGMPCGVRELSSHKCGFHVLLKI